MQSTQHATATMRCTGCNAEYIGHPSSRYCTDRCKWRTKSRRAYKPRTPAPKGTRLCGLCKAPHRTRGLCGPCDNRINGRTTNEATEYRTGTCSHCGAPWRKYRQATTDLCDTCRFTGVQTFPANHRNMDAAGIKRARAAGVAYEHIDVLALFEASNWTCGICHHPVDPDLHSPHTQSQSLDHIVPLNRGGTHTPANTQLAHLKCNADKGDAHTA